MPDNVEEVEKEENIIEVLSQSLAVARAAIWRDDFYRTQKKEKEEKDN